MTTTTAPSAVSTVRFVRSADPVVGDAEAAWDVAEEAFGRLYVDGGKVGRYDHPGAWVRRVAIRLAVKADRRARRIDRRPVPDRRPPPGTVGAVADRADLLAALAALPVQQRAALVLTAIDDLTTDEVAEALGWSPSNRPRPPPPGPGPDDPAADPVRGGPPRWRVTTTWTSNLRRAPMRQWRRPPSIVRPN